MPPAMFRMLQGLTPTWTPVHVWLYRVLGGRFVKGGNEGVTLPVMLLTTTGRRTGQSRTVAVGHIHDGSDVIVIGTNVGMAPVPAWVLNLRDNPMAEVQIDNERFSARAEHIEGEERKKIWTDLVVARPIYEQISKYAGRQLPLIRLQRVTAQAH
jgi:deazaflavin-dependent oxidoreductase (nitroreductase family)